MGAEMGEGLEAHEVRVARLLDRWEALNRLSAPSNTNTASTVFNMGGAGFLIGAVLAVGGISLAYGFHKDAETERIRAISAMEVMAAERRADMKAIESVRQELSAVRDQGSVTNAYALKHEGDIAKLKAGVK